jgi:hypothetical protein
VAASSTKISVTRQKVRSADGFVGPQRHLIEIKVRKAKVMQGGIDQLDGVRSMPTEIILLAFIGAGFCLFAGTLYWADMHTRGLGK